ncbi:hypothetical protein WG902_19640 [Ramlibacter sp. PS3R-8]|uniref:hypothetical protein n=1 Tax=Ramlibacter sp. PS3R-8 TaxID=3133437 RepID=UPI0030AB4D94
MKFQTGAFEFHGEVPAAAPAAPAKASPAVLPPLVVKHVAANDSIFLGDAYLIKGVQKRRGAGGVGWWSIGR